MLKLNSKGSLNALALPFAVVTLLLIVMTGVAFWAYTEYNAQKNNVNTLIAEAVDKSNSALRDELTKEFEEAEKSPLTTYRADEALGSITIKYPKTWSAYISETTSRGASLNAYFHPKYVPDIKSKTAYATRLTVSSASYSRAVSGFAKGVEAGTVTARPIKISGVEGVRVDGAITRDYKGAMVILPLRDKTIQIWTESNNFLEDFNQRILKNFKFIP
jgi:Flp pilus assembly protein TadG